MNAENAIIMAAGTSSRFAPLSFEKHKAMTVVKGEVLIERQIGQLKEAGITDIYIITGYMSEQFSYLINKYGVKLINNYDYLTRNNNSSIWAAKNVLSNSYICLADNYFSENPFENEIDDSYYAAEYSFGHTDEWCMTEDDEGFINSVTIGGENSWYMRGHSFWSAGFSSLFLSILEKEYYLKETADKYWENIYVEHLDILKMKIKKYKRGIMYEFDTLDELRIFDKSYIADTRSSLLKRVALELACSESQINNIRSVKNDTVVAAGFEFDSPKGHFLYNYETGKLDKNVVF